MRRPTLDICIPTYNESTIIVDSLPILADALADNGTENGIIVSDDGSMDGTVTRIATLNLPNIRVLSNPHKGKGAALIAAAESSTAEMFGFIDADLSADPREFKKLVSLVQSGGCDIAIGSRLLDKQLVDRGVFRTSSSTLFNWMRKKILGIRVEDSQCGLKVMNVAGKNLLMQCTEQGWFLDLQFLYKAEKNGLIIREVPIRWVEHRLEGHRSKLRYIADGLSALRAMIRIRLGD